MNSNLQIRRELTIFSESINLEPVISGIFEGKFWFVFGLILSLLLLVSIPVYGSTDGMVNAKAYHLSAPLSQGVGPLVLRNTFDFKLGNEVPSQIGPNLIDVGSESAFAPGYFGNSLTLAGSYSSQQRIYNLTLDGLNTLLSPNQGTVELWYYQAAAPVAYEYNAYRLFDGSYGFNPGIGLTVYEDGNSSNGGGRILFNLGNDAQTVYARDTSDNIGYDISNLSGQWLHIAAVWDRNGINGSADTMRVYLNGQIVETSQTDYAVTEFGSKADIGGGNDGQIAGKFKIDNLKLWNFAKTDFSDRFVELEYLVLWNKLGSVNDVLNSAVGPSGNLTGGNFAQGVFGDAYVAHNDEDLLLTFPSSILPSVSGTIEFWTQLIGFPNAISNSGVEFFTSLRSDGQPSPDLQYRSGFAANDGCGGGGVHGTVNIATNSQCGGLAHAATGGFSQPRTYESILGAGKVGEWHHYALVWNESGISGEAGGKRVAVFMDGNLATNYYHDAASQVFSPIPSNRQLGFILNYEGQGSVAIDNLKIWSFSKTDFSDRFFEGPSKVTGRVTDLSDNPLAGVTITDGMGHSTQSNVAGDYVLLLPSGAYTLSPVKAGLTFVPESRALSVPPELSSMDFVAQSHAISGHVFDQGGVPVVGVTVASDDGHIALTGADGAYTLLELSAGTHTLTLSKAGRPFQGVSRSLTLPPSHTAEDFTVEAYAIRGTARDVSGNPIAGATVTDQTGQLSATTDENGNYLLAGLPAATYILTSAKSGYIFGPISRTLSLQEDTSDIGFLGAPVYLVSGHVLNEKGEAIPDVRIMADTGHSTSSDGSGYYSLWLPAGTYGFTLEKLGFTFPAVTTPTIASDTAGLNFHGYDKPPIVIVPGLMAQESGDPEKLGKTINKPTKDEYEKTIGYLLRDAGYTVEIADIVSSSAWTPPIEWNVPNVTAAIDRVKIDTGQPKVILIGISMGAIISRAYFEGPLYRGDVQSFYSFAGEHQGAPLEYYVAGLFLGPVLPIVCIIQPGICEMNPGMMREYFNKYYRPRGDVDYHLISGAPSLGWKPHRILHFCIPILWWQWCWTWNIDLPDLDKRNIVGWALGWVIPGDDDGFIATASGIGEFGQIMDRAITDDVHSRDVGSVGSSLFTDYIIDQPKERNSKSYIDCLKPVLIDRVKVNCGLRSSSLIGQVLRAGSNMSSSVGIHKALPLASTNETPPSLEQHTPLISGILEASQQQIQTVPVEGGPTAFVTFWSEGTINVSLTDPNGKTIDPTFATDHPELMFYQSDEKNAIYYVANAAAGTWQLHLKGGDNIPPEGVNYSAFAALQSPLSLAGNIDRNWYASGDTAVFTATFSQKPAQANVKAELRYGDGSVSIIQLSSKDGVVYEGSHKVSDIPGYVEVRLSATGMLSQGIPFKEIAFERGTNLMFQVSPADTALTGLYEDSTVPQPAFPSLYESLAVTVGIDSSNDGEEIGLAADLVDPSGNFISHAVARKTLKSGSNTFTLSFPGNEIFASGTNGPYRLTNVIVVGYQPSMLVQDEAKDVHTTAAYDYRSFAPRPLRPVISVSGSYTVEEGELVDLTAIGNDPEGDQLTYDWDLDGDGIFESAGQTLSFPAQSLDGPQTRLVAVLVSDPQGFSAVGQTKIDVVNKAPTVSVPSQADTMRIEPFSAMGSFTDVDSDTWTGTVDYGDGSVNQPLAVDGKTFKLNHRYDQIGVYQVKVNVQDDDGGVDTATTMVAVNNSPGDLDGDGNVDKDDLSAITSSLNTQALGTSDPRDLDRDGKITALDARKLTLLCTKPRCATN